MLFWEWAGTPPWDGVVHVVVSLRPAATIDGHSRWVARARRLFLGQRTVTDGSCSRRTSPAGKPR